MLEGAGIIDYRALIATPKGMNSEGIYRLADETRPTVAILTRYRTAVSMITACFTGAVLASRLIEVGSLCRV